MSTRAIALVAALWAICQGEALAAKVETVASTAEMQSLSQVAVANVVGGTGVDGQFRWDANSALPPNGGTVFQSSDGGAGRWLRVYADKTNVKWFGAAGDGKTDDTAAITSAIAAAKDGSTLFFPIGSYPITSTITVKRNINFLGEGTGSAIKPAVGVDADAIVLDNLGRMVWRDIAILGGDRCCRNALVLNRVHRSRFENVHVRAGASEYGVKIIGSLINYFNFTITINTGYPYPAAMPANSILAQADKDIAVNGNHFDVIIEGGSGNGLRIENQGGEGNNEIRGCVEGVGGKGLYLEGCRAFNINNLHFEANKGNVELVSCYSGTIGPGVLFAGKGDAGNITLTGCSYCRLTDVFADSITIDAKSRKNIIDNCNYGGQGGGISDASGDTLYGYVRCSGNGNLAATGNGAGGAANLFIGGAFEKWSKGSNKMPDYWKFVGGEPIFDKTGDGLADTTRKFSRYAAKVTADATHAPAFALPWDTVKNQWVTVWAWVKIPSGGADVHTRLYYDGGGAVLGGAGTKERDTWVKLQTTYYIEGKHSRADVVLCPLGDTVVYIADAGYAVGALPPPPYLPPASVQQENVLNGRTVTYGDAAPTTGSHEKGDIVFNNNPAGGAYVGWVCVASGTPGTWKTFGAITP